MAAAFDVNRFVKVLNLLRNPNEGERRAAADRAATILLNAPQDIEWSALFAGSDTAALKATIKQLLRDLAIAADRIAELEATAPDWGRDVPQIPLGKSNMAARWAAQLLSDGQIHLNAKEAAFVKDHAKWIGPPTAGQVKFLQAIVDNIYRRYRLRPPP
jgi:hypothetical protein